ncbi:MAG: CDP-alcohol phosphatidyltransferase family protein, partial [Firmicutes bacterium]|nr:CDP-alcohol phosphatidyltransferase family protein [Bacillota bacterium]
YSYGKIIALAHFILAVFSDFLDGYIARKYNLVTNLGKLLDPIADKILTTTGLVLLLSDYELLEYSGIFWLVAVVLIVCVSRDFLNSLIRQVGAEKGKVFAAVWSGKIRTNVVFFTTIFMMIMAIDWNLMFMNSFVSMMWLYLCVVALVATIVANVYSAYDYTMQNKDVLGFGKKEEQINKEEEVK